MGRVVSVCGRVHAVRQNVCSIINADKEKGWTEDASLGYLSRVGHGGNSNRVPLDPKSQSFQLSHEALDV